MWHLMMLILISRNILTLILAGGIRFETHVLRTSLIRALTTKPPESGQPSGMTSCRRVRAFPNVVLKWQCTCMHVFPHPPLRACVNNDSLYDRARHAFVPYFLSSFLPAFLLFLRIKCAATQVMCVGVSSLNVAKLFLLACFEI